MRSKASLEATYVLVLLYREAPLNVIQWKVLILDEGSKKLVDNVVKEDDILNENIASMLCIHPIRENMT